MSDPSTARGVPRPAELVRVDYATKVINLPLVIFGSAAPAMLDEVWNATRGPGVERINHPDQSAAMITYFPLGLGDIRGFKTLIHVYGFGLDHRLATSLALFAPAAAGAVLVFAPGTHVSREAGVLAQVLATALPPSVPVVALGDADLAAAWQSLTGRSPVHVPSGSFEALKAVSKLMLTQLRTAG
jgi:hypothetical protein